MTRYSYLRWSELPVKMFRHWRAQNFRGIFDRRAFMLRWRSPEKLTLQSPRDDDRMASQLRLCCERALDAYTLEDAIFWHSEVINELSVEIFSIAAMSWPKGRKERMLAELTDLQNRHGAILHRLTGIVARNEQLIWQPASICRK